MTVKSVHVKNIEKNTHKHTIKFTKDGRAIYMAGRNKKEKIIHT